LNNETKTQVATKLAEAAMVCVMAWLTAPINGASIFDE